MSFPPLPAINVSSLTIHELHLDKINVDDVAFHKLDTHGYFMNIYIMLWSVFTFVALQTLFLGYFTYRIYQTNRPTVGLLTSKCGEYDGDTDLFDH